MSARADGITKYITITSIIVLKTLFAFIVIYAYNAKNIDAISVSI
jgi:hypothetical protein